MANDKNSLKAGLFILASVVLGVLILVAIKGVGSLFEPMRDVMVAFDLSENVGGLKIGDAVRVGGVEMGKVRDIAFSPGEGSRPAQFRVQFSLPTKFDIRRDAIVQVEQGLTGTSNLNIVAFGAAAPLNDVDVLDGRPSALAELYAIAPELRAKIDPAYARYEAVMNKAEKTLDAGSDAMAHARDILGDTKSDIRGAMANINATTGTLKERLPKTFDHADEFLTKTTNAIEGARGTLEDIRIASANIKDATAEARSLLQRNRTRIDNMITSLRNTGSNLENASSEIRRSPWRLLYQPKPDEVANLNLFDAAREFADAATHLNDAATAVRDAAKDSTMPPERMQELMNSLNLSFDKYKSVEEKLWNAVK